MYILICTPTISVFFCHAGDFSPTPSNANLFLYFLFFLDFFFPRSGSCAAGGQ